MRVLLTASLVLTLAACGSTSHGPDESAHPNAGGGNSSGDAGSEQVLPAGGASGSTGSVEGGSANAAGGDMNTAGGDMTVAQAGKAGDPISPPPANPCVADGTCPLDTWVNVTPMGIQIPDEGLRSVVADPKRASDFYMAAGAAGIWKSGDYGGSWKKINEGFGYVSQGLCLAVLPSEPRTILVAASCGCGQVHKSVDSGATFTTVGGGLPTDLYSFEVDPGKPNHLISGFHEKDGIAESTDAGDSWHVVGGAGFPSGGVSWFPTFIDTGDAETTSKTWLAIAQNGGSPAITHDSGATWVVPTGLEGLTHPHGNAQIFQRGGNIFVAGGGGPGDGVYMSADGGKSFKRVSSTSAAVVWGTPNHVYSMFAWSCFGCTIDPKFQIASAKGDSWAESAVPATMLMGADHVAVSKDADHYVFVSAMRSTGIWRYVEK